MHKYRLLLASSLKLRTMLGQLEDVATTPFNHRGAGFGSHRGDGCTGAATVLDPMVWG